MLLTSALRRTLVVFVIAALLPVSTPIAAQHAAGAVGMIGAGRVATDSIRAPGPRRQLQPVLPVLRIDSQGVAAWRDLGCDAVAACRVSVLRGPEVRQQAATDQRARFGLIGLVVGAAAGWGFYAYQCNHGSDCYSPVGGVLLAAAGGVLGLLVGLLIAPGPGGT